MSLLQISENSFKHMLIDIENLQNSFNITFIECDLSEEKLVLTGLSTIKEECVRIQHNYFKGGVGVTVGNVRKVDREGSTISPFLPPQPKVGSCRRVRPDDFSTALVTIKKIVYNKNSPMLKIIEFKMDNENFNVQIKCAHPGDYLWWGRTQLNPDSDVVLYDSYYSKCSTIISY